MRVEPAEVLPATSPGSGPVVAVLAELSFPQMTGPTAQLVRRFTRTALQTLVDVGANPWLIDICSADRPSLDDVAATADGVLLLGGGDVDSSLYGHFGAVPHEYGVDRDADEYSIETVRQATAGDLPVLGICRGAQVLNVAFGGSLIPDITDFAFHRGADHADLFVDEPIRVAPGSRLGQALQRDRLTVRNGHHQAVDRVGADLVAVAWADDGIVEAVEHERQWIVGVQWHPEDSDGSDEDRHLVFRAFVDEVSARTA